MGEKARRIGKLDTPDKLRREGVRLYREAREGKIPWADAKDGAALLRSLSGIVAVDGDDGEDWGDVVKNALRH